MKRVLIVAVLTLIFCAVWQALANHLPGFLNVFFLPPVILVFILQFFRPLETILACLFCGFITDIIGGMMIGSNMLLMLIAAFILSSVNIFSGRIDRREQVFYVMAVSFFYRIMAILANILFLGSKANISFSQLIFGPLIDGALSVIFYKLLVAMLFLFKVSEQNDFYSNRLGLRR